MMKPPANRLGESLAVAIASFDCLESYDPVRLMQETLNAHAFVHSLSLLVYDTARLILTEVGDKALTEEQIEGVFDPTITVGSPIPNHAGRRLNELNDALKEALVGVTRPHQEEILTSVRVYLRRKLVRR